jgi:hypothetical protein
MDEDRIVIGHGKSTLGKEQKVGLSFVVLCGLGAIVLGGLYLWRHVAHPFAITYTGPQLLLGAEKQNAQVEAEKKMDTDKDEISDYDEKNVYGTSPYLADTDGDGVTDGAEITSGQDPNCAKGKTCDSILQDESAFRNAGVSGTFVDGVTAPVQPVAPAELSGANTTDAAASGELDVNAIAKLQNLSTAEVRDLLVSSGADPATVAGYSEDQIRALYAEILAALAKSAADAQAPAATPNP